MAKSKKVPPFLTVCSFGYSNREATLAGALSTAKKKLQEIDYRTPEFVGIYQLVKVVRREVTPVIVEDIAICKGEV